MSIAINTRHVQAPVKVQRAIAAEHPMASPDVQLREMRALMRHFVLAGLAVGTAVYAIVASGLMV